MLYVNLNVQVGYSTGKFSLSCEVELQFFVYVTGRRTRLSKKNGKVAESPKWEKVVLLQSPYPRLHTAHGI